MGELFMLLLFMIPVLVVVCIMAFIADNMPEGMYKKLCKWFGVNPND